MTTAIVQHGVTDFEVWKQIFDEHGSARASHGATSTSIYRGADDANAITVVIEFPNVAAAKAFTSDPSLK
ncbi:MAG: cyclase, partial [Actinomycetota bacterium]